MCVEKEPESRGGRRPEQTRADALRAPKCNLWYVTAMEEGAQRPTAALKRQRKRSRGVGEKKIYFRGITPNPGKREKFPRAQRDSGRSPLQGRRPSRPQGPPEGPDWFWVSPGKWFDGYQGQSGLVFDEFRDNWQTYSYMLRLLDCYPFRVERKGGFIQMKATRFRFSSNVHPKAWWAGRPGKVAWVEDPLRRRFSRIELMTDVFVQADQLVDDTEAWWDARPEAVAPAARARYGEREG